MSDTLIGPARPPRYPYLTTGGVRVCIDRDCPNCGWPERWADLDLSRPVGEEPPIFGCSRCPYESKERNR